MKRFYLPTVSMGRHAVPSEETAHFYSARIKTGERVVFFNGDGNDYEGEVEIGRKDVAVQIDRVSLNPQSPSRELTVFVGNPKGDKLELIVQKLTELGVCAVVPFLSKFVTQKSQPNYARLNKIAVEAVKQCGGATLPALEPLTGFDSVIGRLKAFDTALLAYENERSKSITSVQKTNRIALIVGSEGGFCASEVEKAEAVGAVAVGLGNRMLRCETAAIVASGILLV